MKVTRMGLLFIENKADEQELFDLMAVFSSAIRFSFNRLLDGKKADELIKQVHAQFKLNKRFAEDAVLQAQAIITSQKELLPSRIEGIQGKIKKTEKKMDLYKSGKRKPKKVLLEVCLKGLHSRLEKLKEKEEELLKHQENNSIPTVIFGGKRNFFDRMENKITKEKWKEIRSNTLYSRGDKSKKGNLNTRIVWNEIENQFYLEVANPLLAKEGKHSPRLQFKLTIPDKYFEEIVNAVMPNIAGAAPSGKPLGEYNVYSIELKRKNKKVYVHITHEINTAGSMLNWNEKITSDIVAGIDVNIDKITVSILTKQGNLLESKTFYCHEMEYVKSNRRTNIAGELAKEIMDYLLSWNVRAIVLEKIKIKQDHDTDRRFNRLVHSFAKTKMQKALISRGLKFGFKIKMVNPAYTSVIGRFKYSKMYGLSVHEAASFVIGRRGLDFEEKLPKEVLKQLQNVVKPHLVKTLGTMEVSEKKTKTGKQRRKYIGLLLNNIDTFKEHHIWKLWNVVHKTIRIENHVFKLKEV